MALPWILFDAHVHFHARFDLERFLESASANFHEQARRRDLQPVALGVLMLAERAGDRFFRRFRETAGTRQAGAWGFRATNETTALLAMRGEQPRLVLIEGRQVVSAEGLEVLALACAAELVERRPIRETLAAIRAADGLPVLPWGVGKWWLGRGRIVSTLLDEEGSGRLFLGDNGGRLSVLPRPALLREGARRGFRILPGTDPLPLHGQSERIGSFGFAIRDEPQLETPATWIKNLLRDEATALEAFGSATDPASFLQAQLTLRLRRKGE